MITVDARKEQCPIPVVKAKKALKEAKEKEEVKVLVDNEIAVQNLIKMANQMRISCSSKKLGEKEFEVVFITGKEWEEKEVSEETEPVCIPDSREKNTVVVISSDRMGTGNDELGAVLMKGFIYALGQMEKLPSTILFYNGGAKLSTEGSDSLEDLKGLEAQGVEILTCGTCLNYYNLSDKLKVGGVTNMYVITEKMTGADSIIRP